MSRVTSASLHFGAIIIVTFVMVILNLLADSSCKQLEKAIGQNEKLLKRLEKEQLQAQTHWDQMKTPEKLEAALLRHGMKMLPAHADQNIHMKSDGTPYSGLALVKLNGRRPPVASNAKTKSARKMR